MSSFYWLGFKKIWGFLKKALIVFVVYIIVISLFFYFSGEKKSYNQKSVIDNYRTEIYRTINDPELNKNEAGKIAINIYRNLLCGLIGEACTDNPSDGDKNFDQSLFGFAIKLITLPTSNPPASASYWAYSGLIYAGFIPKTYAATVSGIGLAALTPIATVWMVFRNLLYMLFVLIIIAIGFMIMFRMKINPQTVISLENSLPKIVIALLLITFSLPIAGFLVDLMYITCGIIILLFESQVTIQGFSETASILYDGIFKKPDISIQNFFIGWPVIKSIPEDISHKTATYLYYLLPDIIRKFMGMISVAVVYKLLGSSFTKLTGKQATLSAAIAKILEKMHFIKKSADNVTNSGTPFISFVSAVLGLGFIISEGLFIGGPLSSWLTINLLYIIFIVSLLFTYFRIFFMLLYSYIQTIISIIFSPVILSFEAIPGKSSFASWIKTMIYHLSTWPLLITVILINQALILQIENNPSGSNIFLPPFIDIGSSNIVYIISALLLFLTPDIIKNLKEMMGLKPQDLGISLGGVFAGAAAGGGLMQLLGQYQTISMITGWKPIEDFFKRASGKQGEGFFPALSKSFRELRTKGGTTATQDDKDTSA